MSKSNTKTIIDQLGRVHAQIQLLESEAESLKSIVREWGDGDYEGEISQIHVQTADRHTLDMKAVKKKLSPQFIKAHTKIKPVTSVTITARPAVVKLLIDAPRPGLPTKRFRKAA